MLNSKIPFIVFVQVCFFKTCFNTSQELVHNNNTCLWTLLVTADRGCLMFSIACYVVCVLNYSVPPYLLTPTYLEEAGGYPSA